MLWASEQNCYQFLVIINKAARTFLYKVFMDVAFTF